MLESIAAATLHLGFPVSVDMNRPNCLKGSTTKRTSKKGQTRHVEELPSHAAAHGPSRSYQAFDWLHRLSDNYMDLFNCGQCYASHDIDNSDIDANSIVLGVPVNTQTVLTENQKTIFLPLTSTPNSRFPALQRAHPINNDDGFDKPTSSLSCNESNPDILKPELLVAKQNKDLPSEYLRNSSRRSQEGQYDADEECTTATTASVRSIASWNTMPTRDTSFDSISILDNFVSFRSYEKDMEGSCLNENHRSPRSVQLEHVLVSPSHLRRFASDPIYAV